MKTRVSVLSLFFTVLLSGCADVFSEPEESDILSELIILHTGEIVMIHRGGCNDFEKKWNTDVVSIDDYIKYKNHYYCHCVNDSIMDMMSDANYKRQMALDGWCSEYYVGEYFGQIEERVAPYYNSNKGRDLQFVLTDNGYEVAKKEDKIRLREIEKERFCKKYPKLKDLWN